MGQRANLVTIAGGQRRLFYDHWCANRLDVELFWGPQLAAQFVAQREAVEEPSGWLDILWCEGAALIDFDRRLLLWYGGSQTLYDLPWRRTLLELMAHQWPGWRIVWAQEGLLSIADELGLPRGPFRVAPYDSGPLFLNTSFPEDNSVMTSVRTADGTLLTGRLCGTDESLGCGPALLDVVIANASPKPVAWTGEFPHGGVHIDVVARMVDTWWTHPAPDLLERARAAWPGWTVRWHHDHFEHHLELADCRFVFPDSRAVRGEVLANLEHCMQHEARNPARDLLPVLGKDAGSVELNPATDNVRGSIGDVDAKRAILRRLSSRGM